MERWEYKFVTVGTGAMRVRHVDGEPAPPDTSLHVFVNQLAEEGWRIAHLIQRGQNAVFIVFGRHWEDQLPLPRTRPGGMVR